MASIVEIRKITTGFIPVKLKADAIIRAVNAPIIYISPWAKLINLIIP